ncbi:MAG: FAD/NAD(P)-binding protein [Myxococcales bacterium]|nr:FAD/NAD(P)-binding protein [Myxococcales bacterium]
MSTAPPAPEGRQVVIIGGGVSGVALTIHMLTLGAARVAIVERREGLGRGPAYGTSDPALRLNVPGARMSLFPERPGDFLEWARAHADWSADEFLPRRLFGAYVEARLADAARAAPGRLAFFRSEAVDADTRRVTLADGTALACDAVVLATGNQLPAAPAAFDAALLASPRVVGDPWADGALSRVAADESVLLIGTGLTAVDVLLALHNHGHRGQLVAVSRHGLLPRPHLPADDPGRRPFTLAGELPRDVVGLCRRLRAEVRRAAADGVAWQSVIDALRPHTTSVWRSLPLSERRRFMTAVRPYWEVLRHRAAPDLLARIAAWRRDGRLEILAASVAAAREQDGVLVDLRPRRGPAQRRRFDRVVLCTGPQTDVRRWPGELYRRLLAAGELVGDPLGLGVVTDESGRVQDAAGRPSSWLFALGALRRPHLWETTAVPDIVRHALALARLLTTRECDDLY